VTDDNRLRLGGRVGLPSGEVVVWSVADGRRGRRWRESVARDGVQLRAILFETDRSGRVERLEISSPTGLLTLHPDADGSTLHGNVVTPDGIRHLTFPWGTRDSLFVVGSPAAAAIALGRLAETVAIGATARVATIRIDTRLEPSPWAWDVSRVDERTWHLVEVSDAPAPEERTVRLDADGLVDLPGCERWPLEQ
jgi:hypothetical protein